MRWLAAPLLAAPLTGCAALAADDDRVQVTAGFYPLAWVAERVGGADVDVVGLTDPGVEPHDIEPTFARTVALARADLVVVEHGLQPAIDDAVEQNAEGRVLDVTDVVHLRPRAAEPSDAEEGDATTTTATSTRTSGSTRSCSPTSATRWPPTWPTSTRRTPRRTPPTLRVCAPSSQRSTPTSPPAWPTANGT